MQKTFSLSVAQGDMQIYKSVMPKSQVCDYAINLIDEYKKVEITNTTHAITEIFDISGEPVFAEKAAMFGWLIFIDNNILANWGHDCEYIFLIDRNMKFHSRKTMPPMNLSMEEV
jgi:hypothetical protein